MKSDGAARGRGFRRPNKRQQKANLRRRRGARAVGCRTDPRTVPTVAAAADVAMGDVSASISSLWVIAIRNELDTLGCCRWRAIPSNAQDTAPAVGEKQQEPWLIWPLAAGAPAPWEGPRVKAKGASALARVPPGLAVEHSQTYHSRRRIQSPSSPRWVVPKVSAFVQSQSFVAVIFTHRRE